MGLIQKTIQFSVAGKVEHALRTSTYKQWAGVGAGVNTARNLINRHKTKKELMSQGVDKDQARELAKQQHGGVIGAALKGAAVGTVARGGAKLLGLKANAADKRLASIKNSNVKSAAVPKPTTVSQTNQPQTVSKPEPQPVSKPQPVNKPEPQPVSQPQPVNKPKPKSKPKKSAQLQQAESKAQVATDLNNANESRRTLGGRIAGALGLGSQSEKAAREGFAFNNTTHQWENPKTGETRRATYKFSDIRQFSTQEQRDKLAEKRKNTVLGKSHRGIGRSLIVGELPGVIGMYGHDKLAEKMYKEGYPIKEIRKAIAKRSMISGGVTGAVSGVLRSNRGTTPSQVLANVALGSTRGAVGAGLGADKKFRSRYDKRHLDDIG